MTDQWVATGQSRRHAVLRSLVRRPRDFIRARFARERGMSLQYDVPTSNKDVLARVVEMPLSTWTYGFDDASVKHLGPMAQDFAKQFGLGSSDRVIHPVDGIGVALASIQALNQRIEELEALVRHPGAERRDPIADETRTEG